jgi:hypothetical protein
VRLAHGKTEPRRGIPGALVLCGLELPLYSDAGQTDNTVRQDSHRCSNHGVQLGGFADGAGCWPSNWDHWRLVAVLLD